MFFTSHTFTKPNKRYALFESMVNVKSFLCYLVRVFTVQHPDVAADWMGITKYETRKTSSSEYTRDFVLLDFSLGSTR